MTATCPQCTASDEAVAVPEALADARRPLDEPVRAQLAAPLLLPPEPEGVGGGAITCYVLAGLVGLLQLRSLVAEKSRDEEVRDAAYQAGAVLGPWIVVALLLGIGVAVQVARRRRRAAKARAAGLPTREEWSPELRDQRKRQFRVWEAAWLCRRCLVAFFPDGAVRPDFPASPAIPVGEFPLWVVTAAERAFGPEAMAPRT
ncbi:hypothetical protein [Kitasatospora sp. NBC_00458]|uniref:hypothetical protein n=1 Tax=Kitasatospora sp. NBC_00458 TaxID=2903568 RepID=UPI002E16CFBE